MSDVEYGQKPRMGQNLGWSRDVEFGPKPRMGQNLGWVPGMWNLVKNADVEFGQKWPNGNFETIRGFES